MELTGAARHEERKLVSILFVDQVGSTSRADGADPEDVRDRNRIYYEETRARIERHGGMLEKYAGDAVMAVFGVPLARANDAESAVRAALSILEGIRQLNEAHPGLDLDVRVGICTGEAIVEIDAPAESALATGDCVNVAARLQSAAPPGRAIVGAETYRLTKQAFRYEALSPVVAKGKREPVATWLVEEPLASSQSGSELTAPLIGRSHEMILMRSVWAHTVSARQPHLVSVIGEAGIGKSRLTSEIASEIERAGALVLWARSHPYDQQTPYRAVAQLVRQTAEVFENDAVDVARRKLAAMLGSLVSPDEVASMTRYLSLLLGLGLDERARETVELQYATRRLFESLAEQTPLMIVFDDIQWADEASLDLVGYLSNHVQAQPIVIVALARPELLEQRPAWGAGLSAFTSLRLNPLSAEDAGEAASALLSQARPGVIAKIVATAEGNPLFIEELVASIEDEETAERLPSTIRAVIAARIDGLPADARSVLLNASVIGKTFWRGVLSHICDVTELGEALDALETRGLIHRRSASRVAGDVEFSFKHDLILDTAYATLPRATRRELHAATAAAMESLVADPAELAFILAHHWREAGDSERARSYLLVGAARALDALAVEETHDLYTQAVDLAADATERTRIKLLRGLALVQLEDFARAAAELAELIPNLEGEQKVEAVLGRVHATLWTEQSEATMAGAELALQLARAGSYSELEPVALGLLSSAYGMRGDEGDLEKALELGDRALKIWVPNARKADLAEQYHLVSDVYYWMGDYERAMGASELAATTAGVDLHSREFRLRGAGMRAIVLAGVGRYEEAMAAAEDAIELASQMGRAKNVVTNYSTLPLREIFALDEALERSEAVAERLGPSDFNMPWMMARADAFAARVIRGDVSDAQDGWRSLWEDAVTSKAWERWVVTGRLAAARADLELLLGHPEEAVTWGARAIEMAVASSRRKYEAIARTTVGRSLVAQRLYEDAAVELRRAVALADALGSPLLRWQSRAALAQALAKTGPDPDAVYDEAARIIRAVAANLTSQRAATYLSAPQVAEVLEATG
jgi:class 3 adenylate cyclase/tetratricopeptide (TPR) repeat protein